MTKLRGVALALVIGGIAAALVPAFGAAGPAKVPVVGQPVASVATTMDTNAAESGKAQHAKDAAQRRKQSAASPSATAQGDGPNINERKKQANDERRQNKLIAGGIAVVLLLIVLWGRRVRSKRRNPDS